MSFLSSPLYSVTYLILLSDLKACHPPDPLLSTLFFAITCMSFLFYPVTYLILLSDLKSCHPPDLLLSILFSPITCMSFL